MDQQRGGETGGKAELAEAMWRQTGSSPDGPPKPWRDRMASGAKRQIYGFLYRIPLGIKAPNTAICWMKTAS
jgi:hypothetical protein